MKRKRKIYVSACLSLCLSDEDEMSCRGGKKQQKKKERKLALRSKSNDEWNLDDRKEYLNVGTRKK
jgi:hypothetical protein